jgi:hypothetical protein
MARLCCSLMKYTQWWGLEQQGEPWTQVSKGRGDKIDTVFSETAGLIVTQHWLGRVALF